MKYSIVLDIGGTKIEGALINEKYKIISHIFGKTHPKLSRQHIITHIIEVVNELKTKPIVGVGIARPGFMDEYGRLQSIYNLPALLGCKIQEILQKELGDHVISDNDANCFALGERQAGNAKDYNRVIGLILGTGVGAGIIIDGKIIRGSKGLHPEIAHLFVGDGEIKCTCGRKGDLESFCAGPNIVKYYKYFGGKIKGAGPEEIMISKERAARKTREQFYEMLSRGISNLYDLYFPEIVVIGGGVSNLNIFSRLPKMVAQKQIRPLPHKVKIVRKRLPNSALVGAASIVFSKSFW